MPRKSKDRRVVMLAGFVAGGLEATATWPTEYVKTQLQLQRGTGLYRGFWDCARQTVGQYGPLGLYRGLGPVLVFSMPKAGVRFWAFETASKLLGGGEKKASAARNFAAGIMAGVLEATLIVTPQETLKVKLINANKGMLAGTAHIVRTEGLRGVYRGLFPTILKQASNQGVRFLSYNEIMNRFIKPGRPDQPPTAAQALLGGMSAGCISVLGAWRARCDRIPRASALARRLTFAR